MKSISDLDIAGKTVLLRSDFNVPLAKDGSGVISADEIKEVLGFNGNLDKSAIDLIMKQVDENGDGEISFEEFVSMMKSVGV